MRGEISKQSGFFSYVDLESRIPAARLIRNVRDIVDAALLEMDSAFDEMYSRSGRQSIPPEQPVCALLLQILFTIRSKRQLMERQDYDLMFHWFAGLGVDHEVWYPTVFTKNRDCVLAGNVDELFFDAIKKQAYANSLMSRDHFSVDGALLEACASMKFYKPKRGTDHDGRDFHGQARSNDTHASTTDRDARLFRKSAGKGTRLCHMGHLLTENRHGLIVDAEVTQENSLKNVRGKDGTALYTYNSANQLVRQNGSFYAEYDGNGNRFRYSMQQWNLNGSGAFSTVSYLNLFSRGGKNLVEVDHRVDTAGSYVKKNYRNHVYLGAAHLAYIDDCQINKNLAIGVCGDLDDDGDGLTYLQELDKGTYPFDKDSDHDGLPDYYDLFPTNANPVFPLEAAGGYKGSSITETVNQQ